MRHWGNISKIVGSELPPVDVVIGGSPCQDLSVAGKREGLAGGRSGLFMEQIRVVKELREHDRRNGRTGEFVRPRFMVWENVEGALSSPGGKNRGADFGAVLEETVRVAEPDAPPVPVPEKGWPRTGCLYGMDGGWSLAWRVLDGRYWGPTQEADGRVLHLGTPQRRRRIALVADFGGVTAPEILFERGGLPGHPEPRGETGEGTATGAGDGTGAADPADGGERLIAFAQNQRDEVRDLGGVAGALAAELGMKQQTFVAQPMAIAFGAKQQSMVSSSEVAATLGANDYKELQVVACPATGGAGHEPALLKIRGGAERGGAKDRAGERMAATFQNTGVGWWNESPVAATIRTPAGGDSMLANVVVRVKGFAYDQSAGSGSLGFEPEMAPTLRAARHDAAVLAPDVAHTIRAKGNCDFREDSESCVVGEGMIVRRLTPLECERLQGYPDGWTLLPVIETMTREEFEFWDRVRREWAEVEGKRYATPKTVEGMVKWWNKMATSDSHRYKALGNSICLPGWKWICKRISAQYERDATMGSLFDGIGGFPYLWQQLNGPGTCLWASEVEPFQIAVTRLRIGS